MREALRRPGVVEELFVDPTAGRLTELISAARGTGVHPTEVSARDLAGLTDTVTPQGIVAVCRRVDVPLADVLVGTPGLVVCGVQVRDPGNVGTLIRSADAFGANAVLLTKASVDLYNPKTVRASVGSLFHLPLSVEVDLASVVAAARQGGLQVLAADGAAETQLPDLVAAGALTRPTVWLFGNEAWGLAQVDRQLADQAVRVPIYGAAESLNLATAAAVCLYASATAQRLGRTPTAAKP